LNPHINTPVRKKYTGTLSGESIICFAGEDWWYHNPHSNKHLMQELARNGNRVLFVNSTGIRTPRLFHDRYAWKRIMRKLRSLMIFLRRAEPRLYVLTPVALPFTRRLRHFILQVNKVLLALQVRAIAALLGMSRPIAWVATPALCEGAFALRRNWAKLLIYYCVDNTAYLSDVDTPFIQTLYSRLAAGADLVFFSGRRMLKESLGLNRNTYLLPHGVEFDHFAQTLSPAKWTPEELRKLRAPIVGYIGEIKGINVELIGELAQRNPDVSFVLIGNVMMDVTALARYDNVHFLGRRPYEALPAYLSCFRCCAIFYRGGITFNEYRSPKKLLEYFATGLPLVSTELAELERFPNLVYQAATAEEFHQQLQRALAESDPALREQRIEAARSRDWYVVAEEASQHIVRHLRDLAPNESKAASSA
jgi:glycosyltransferase involved in cell wall biosynthesis